MFGLTPDEKKIAQLLKQQGDFNFNKTGIKTRLLTSVHNTRFREHAAPKKFYQHWTIQFGTCLALVLLLVSGVSYANGAKPGDKLYFLDLFEEKIELTLPRTAASRTQLQSAILSERVEEIDEIKGDDAKSAALKIKTINSLQQNLIKAVDDAASTKARLEEKGKDKSVDKVNRVLNNLEKTAGQEERRWEQSKGSDSTDQEQRDWEARLEEIKKAREKARLETESWKMRSHENTSEDPTSTQDRSGRN